MRKKDQINIQIEETDEYSSIEELLDDLKNSTLEKFNSQTKCLNDIYKNVQITGISISHDEDYDETCDGGYSSHSFPVFTIEYERDETPKEEKQRLAREAKEAARKIKEKAAKEAKKLKAKEDEYKTYLALKKKYEKIKISTFDKDNNES